MQIFIVSTDTSNFPGACQSTPPNEQGYIGSMNDASCELLVAAEMTGELFNSDPLAFLPDVEGELGSVAYGFAQDSLGMCISPESIRVSYRWEDNDAKEIANRLLGSKGDETKAFAQYVRMGTDSSFITLALSALAATTQGCILTASILKQLRNTDLGVAILLNMKNPARAARILNLWEYKSVSQRDKITLALNRISFAENSEGRQRSYAREHMYQYGTSINADSFHNPLTAIRISESLLIGFDKYEEASHSFGQRLQKTSAARKRARSTLEAHLATLVSRNLIKPCHISYSRRGIIDAVECALVPPPPPTPKRSDATVREEDNPSDDEKMLTNLTSEYEYCEELIDVIVDALIGAQHYRLDSSEVYSLRELIITITDTINDIIEDEETLMDRGYDPSYFNSTQELKLLLDEIENEFIDLENAAIDLEFGGLESETDVEDMFQ